MTTEELTAKISVLECHLEEGINDIIREIPCNGVSIYLYEICDETGQRVKPSIRLSL